MSDKERIAELEELNDRLANQLVGSVDRLQESVRQIKAEAWDEGYEKGYDDGTAILPTDSNPYRIEAA